MKRHDREEHPAILERKRLTELGLIEDSGNRRLNPTTGQMDVLWRVSRLGKTVFELQERLAITLETALAMAKTRH